MERVVITGASAGIGAACVEAFHREGAEVVGVDLTESSGADTHFQMDLAAPDCGAQLLSFLGDAGVDGLVNNAGIGLNKKAVDTDASEFDHVMAVNLRAPLLLASALYPSLASRWGFVVNVASVHANATSRLVAAYAASKGGLVALGRSLAMEWAPEVRVNAVLPGAIETEMLLGGLSRTQVSIESLSKKHPLKRVGNPSEIADAVLFLAGNAFTTGITLTIDGGATAHLSTE